MRFLFPGIAAALAASGGNIVSVPQSAGPPDPREIYLRRPDSPLVKAALAGDVAKAIALIEGGVSPNEVSPSGLTALSVAAANGMLDLGSALLARKADPSLIPPARLIPPIFEAIDRGHLKFVELLLKNGVRVDGKAPYNPLSEAIASKQDEIAQYLLDHGAKAAPSDSSPLDTAVAHRQLKWVRILLERGVDPNRTVPGFNPMGFSVVSSTAEIARVLFKAGLKPAKGMLLSAMSTENPEEMTRAYLDAGADPNENTTGKPIIQIARESDKAWLVELLRKHGAKEN